MGMVNGNLMMKKGMMQFFLLKKQNKHGWNVRFGL